MAKYFFHVREGETFIEDVAGVDLEDEAEAHKHALLRAREILSEWILRGHAIDGQSSWYPMKKAVK